MSVTPEQAREALQSLCSYAMNYAFGTDAETTVGKLRRIVAEALAPSPASEVADINYLADVLASEACRAAKLNPREHWTDVCIALKPILHRHLSAQPKAPSPSDAARQAKAARVRLPRASRAARPQTKS